MVSQRPRRGVAMDAHESTAMLVARPNLPLVVSAPKPQGILLPGLPEKYQIIKKYNSTPSSGLYKGIEQKTKQEIFVKECFYKPDFQRELTASVKLSLSGNNDFIVPIQACFPEQQYLIMPYMEGRTLWNYTISMDGLEPEWMFDLASQIAQGLEQIHGAGIIHNDLKSGNVLLTASSASRRLTAKITDFGFSSCGVAALEPFRGAGTPQYVAPEKKIGKNPLTSAVDIFSFGLLVHEMLTNKLLYEVITPSYRQVIPAHPRIPDKVLEVIRTACEFEPGNRFKTAGEMINALEAAVYSI